MKEWAYQKLVDDNFQSENRLSSLKLREILKRHDVDVNHCEACGVKRTKKIRITVHHLDGNPCNNHPENLGVLCREGHDIVEENERTGLYAPLDCNQRREHHND